ncbi:MAG: hypothetical protein QNL24_06185 [Akkermansiaceae bacterium]
MTYTAIDLKRWGTVISPRISNSFIFKSVFCPPTGDDNISWSGALAIAANGGLLLGLHRS